MKNDVPNFLFFKSDLRAQIRVRNLENIAELVPNLSQNASDPHSVQESSDNDAQQNPNGAHRLMSCLIWTMHSMILKHPQKGSLKGNFTLVPPNGHRGNL